MYLYNLKLKLILIQFPYDYLFFFYIYISFSSISFNLRFYIFRMGWFFYSNSILIFLNYIWIRMVALFFHFKNSKSNFFVLIHFFTLLRLEILKVIFLYIYDIKLHNYPSYILQKNDQLNKNLSYHPSLISIFQNSQ